MIYLTVFMLILYLVSAVRGGLFSSFRKNYVKMIEDDGNGNTRIKDDVSDGDALKLVIHSIWVSIVALAILVLQFVFIVSALSVDIFFIPTAIILTLFIGNLILAFTGKNKKTAKDLETRTGWQIFNSILFLIYIIYILVLLVI